MKISVLCSDPKHPVFPHLLRWCEGKGYDHQAQLVSSKLELEGGDLLFLISCHDIMQAKDRAKFTKTLVIHASDLPDGRGWSPLAWQIIEGRDRITVTLMETEDAVDTGAIWAQEMLAFDGHELSDEINASLFAAEMRLMDFAVAEFGRVVPRAQVGDACYYRRRTPDDSMLDPHKTIAEQFNILRVADPDRYPAFFEWLGHRYEVMLRKVSKVSKPSHD